MAKSRKGLRVTLTFLFLVALVGFTACRSTQLIATQWDDNVITTKVKSKLAADPQVSALNISVTTDEGAVTLTGRVKDAQQRAEAEKLARDTEGVKKVNNLIKVGELREGEKIKVGDLREPTKASTVIGQRVKDPAGKDVGTVKDLILDREARATHAILAVGGFLGMGEKRVAVPLSSLTFKEDKTVIVDKRKEDLEKAPSYEEPKKGQ